MNLVFFGKIAFKKDETPYLVFICSKCRQYSYVKTTKKTKKCLRCGRTHQVKNLLGLGEIVYGMTAAVNAVKQKQNELTTPEFRSEGDFVVATDKFPTRTIVKKSKKKVPSDKDSDKNVNFDFKEQFIEILLELSKLYNLIMDFSLRMYYQLMKPYSDGERLVIKKLCSELYQVNLEEFLPKDEKKAFLELENKITHEGLQLMLTDQEKTKQLQKSQKQIAKMNKDLKYIKEIWDFRANTAYHLAFHDELFITRLKKVMT